MNGEALKARLRAEALTAGFAGFGVAAAGPCRDGEHLEQWLAAGRHGTMHWLERGCAQRTDPTRLLPGARSVISLLFPYYTVPPAESSRWARRISRYAWGADYHRWLGRRLRRLVRSLAALSPRTRSLIAIDSKPVLEREWAERAGLGWIGKNTNLVTTAGGSWFFLAEIITDLDLPSDDGPHPDRCGTCTACIEACPTGAILAPGVLDARRCISYLTIEHRGAIPPELRSAIGSWIFGCDICQDVCPWNRSARPTPEPRCRWDPARLPADPAELLALDEKTFAERLAGSPLRRSGRDRFLRNVCISLGNEGDAATGTSLVRTLGDPSALVRAHAAWALGQLGGRKMRTALADRLREETEPTVRQEIANALADGE